MASVSTGLGLILLIVLALLSWIAGSRASRLRYGGSAERLHRKTRAALVPSAWLLAAGAAETALAVWDRSRSSDLPADRSAVHLPLLVLPLLFVAFLSLPRLWTLYRDTALASGAPLRPDLRYRAADPAMVTPLQWCGLACLLNFYFFFVSPTPLSEADTLIPLLLFAAAAVALFYANRRRRRRVGFAEPDADELTFAPRH